MRVFNPVGWDGTTFIWTTPSWTRQDHPGHELHLDRDSGYLKCSCESATFECKGCNLLDAPRLSCKHGRLLASVLLDRGPEP